MENFEEIKPAAITENFIKLIGSDWMLVTAGQREHFNTMTASWGGVGFLWNKNRKKRSWNESFNMVKKY